MGTDHFENIKVGDEKELTHTLTAEDVQVFTQLTGDTNPLHTDAQFARRAGFGGPVVHGMLSAAFISTMIGTMLPGRGALWASQTLEFKLPAHVGDRISVMARVKHKSEALRMLVLEISIKNQRGQELVAGEAKVKMLELQEENGLDEREHKTILISGGSRGIGAAIARRLSADGHLVVVNYHSDPGAAQRLAAEIKADGGKAHAVYADVSDPDSVSAMFKEISEKVGAVHGLVHCAAPESGLKAWEHISWADFERQWQVQLRGAYNCVQAVLPGMLTAGSGSIVFIGSIASDGTPPPQQADYVVAKAALAALARALAVEVGPKGVRVNVISPGMTQTERLVDFPEKAKMLARMQAPLRKLAEPDDVASVAAFLLSADAKHITGETIRVSGGTVMG